MLQSWPALCWCEVTHVSLRLVGSHEKCFEAKTETLDFCLWKCGPEIVNSRLPQSLSTGFGIRTVQLSITRWHSCPGVLFSGSMFLSAVGCFDVTDRIPTQKVPVQAILVSEGVQQGRVAGLTPGERGAVHQGLSPREHHLSCQAAAEELSFPAVISIPQKARLSPSPLPAPTSYSPKYVCNIFFSKFFLILSKLRMWQYHFLFTPMPWASFPLDMLPDPAQRQPSTGAYQPTVAP